MFQDGANTGSSLASNKRKFFSAEHFSNPGGSKRSFDSIGYFSDMDQAMKRNSPGMSRRLISAEHAPGLSRPKKALDSVDRTTDNDSKRRLSSIDRLDVAALKRVFDSIGDMSDMSGVKKNFDSIAHYSDMNDMKRNDERRLGSGATLQHSSDMDSSERQFDIISHRFDPWELRKAAFASDVSQSIRKRAFDSNERVS